MRPVSSEQAGAGQTAVGLRAILAQQGGALTLHLGPASLGLPQARESWNLWPAWL